MRALTLKATLIAIITLSLFSCSEDECYAPFQIKTAADQTGTIPTHDFKKLELDEGTQANFELSGHTENIVAQLSNERVAKVEIDKITLRIIALAPGETKIKLLNKVTGFQTEGFLKVKEVVKPEEPKEEPKEDPNMPTRIDITFAEGHMHGDYAFHQSVDVEEMKHMKAVVRFSLEKTEKGWTPKDGKYPKITAMSSTPKAQSVYGLWIRYYNKEGEDITANFVENGNDSQYQHFFTATDIKPTFDWEQYMTYDPNGAKKPEGTYKKPADYTTEEYMAYRYCDTNPWNQTYYKSGGKVKIKGNTNPVGMKGYFKFNVERTIFNLNIELKKIVSGKLIGQVVTPFHTPSNRTQYDKDFNLKFSIPICVFASIEETNDWEAEEDTLLEELNPIDLKFIKSLARAYEITEAEAYRDMLIKVYGDYDREGGELAF
ncbi:MAG: hypothetical protein Q3992_04515 [Bacteroides sp.]|nr:hypothetical protein [Bacteroides sp.]